MGHDPRPTGYCKECGDEYPRRAGHHSYCDRCYYRIAKTRERKLKEGRK